jgi:hypothetical protein
MPLWLVIFVALASIVWCARAQRDPSHARSPAFIEGSLLVTVVGSVAILLTTASLPGALGSFQGFDDAQFLAGAQLVFVHGLLPWRDLYFLHGLLEDVFAGAIGMAVFSHSRWGSVAGQMMIVYPLQACLYYLFAVYFARRNRLIPLIMGMLIIGGYVPGLLARFAFLPLILILFDKMLRTRSRFWCFLFSLNLVIQSIVTPEIGLLALGVAVTLVASDWYGRVRLERTTASFYRTLWCGVFALGLSLCVLIYLVVTRSLGAFIDYYELNIGSHLLWGALPITWFTVGDIRTVVFFYLPIVLYFATFWRTVVKLRNRSSWSSRDWTMVAAATFVVLYSQKALDRADYAHVAEVFTVCLPFTILWGIEAITSIDRGISDLASRGPSWLRRRTVGSISALPRALTLLAETPALLSIMVAVLLPATLPGVLTPAFNSPAATHASVPSEPTLSLLGYTQPGAVDVDQIRDLARFLDYYVPPQAPVFDFSNEPGILYFLLDRVPGTRFFTIQMAETTQAQQLAISELRSSQPRLVVFSNNTFGLPGTDYDNIVGMIRNYQVSQYLLTHYVPFADVDGQLVMLRRDLVHSARPPSSVGVPLTTANLYFAQPPCNWGDVPNFLEVPATVAQSRGVSLAVTSSSPGSEVITGWAVDDQRLQPAKEVIAVVGQRVVATTRPDIYRPDVATYFVSKATTYSGFRLDVPSAAIRQHVQIYSLNVNGTVSRLGSVSNTPSPVNFGNTLQFLTTPNGVRHRVQTSGRPIGFVEQVAYSYRLSVPAGIQRSQYAWLRLTFARPLTNTNVVFGDDPEVPSHQISLSILASSRRSINVNVGACSQWYGYRARTMTLLDSGENPVVSVHVVR